MKHEQPSTSRTPHQGSGHDMVVSPTSGPTRVLARKQGMARMSAVTLGVGAASLAGAVGIAVSLPDSTAASTAKSASAARVTPSTSTGTTDGSSSELQTTTAPATTDAPPVVTSGGS